MSSGYTPSRFSILTAERPSLDQFVLLSLMLHVLAIVLFGDTTGGGARRGEKLWGALTVNVQRLLPDNTAGLKFDQGTPVPAAPARNTQPAPVSPGTPSPDRDVRASTPTEAPPPVADTAPPAQAPTFEMPSVISTDVEKAVTEFVVPKASADRVFTPSPIAAEPLPRAAPAALPSVPLPVVKAPLPLTAAPTVIERALLSPLPIAIPVEPVLRKEAAIVPATLSDLPPPMVEREAAKPVVTATEPKPREIVPPIVQPAVAASTAPPKPEREIAQPSAPPTRADASTSPPLEREAVKSTTPPQVSGAPATTAPARAPTGAPSGTLSADRDLLRPRGDASALSTNADVTAPALGKAPAIDLDAVRKRAREINSGTGSHTLFGFPGTPPPKPKSKEQQAFDKALKKNDCRDAYADMGLAAVVPLVLDSVREGGCKW